MAQLLKALKEAPAGAPNRPIPIIDVENATQVKWWLDIVDPGWRERQTVSGGLFGKAV
jgi:hypothetical protein